MSAEPRLTTYAEQLSGIDGYGRAGFSDTTLVGFKSAAYRACRRSLPNLIAQVGVTLRNGAPVAPAGTDNETLRLLRMFRRDIIELLTVSRSAETPTRRGAGGHDDKQEAAAGTKSATSGAGPLPHTAGTEVSVLSIATTTVKSGQRAGILAAARRATAIQQSGYVPVILSIAEPR